MFQQSCFTVSVKKSPLSSKEQSRNKGLKTTGGIHLLSWCDEFSWLIDHLIGHEQHDDTIQVATQLPFLPDTLGKCVQGHKGFPPVLNTSAQRLPARWQRCKVGLRGVKLSAFCLDGISGGTTSEDKNGGRVEVEELPRWQNLFICGVGVGRNSSGEKTDGRGQRREARNRGLHAPATFSLRFFAKWAEQKAEVRFLPFQCDEDRKWPNLNTGQIGLKALLDERTAVKIQPSRGF